MSGRRGGLVERLRRAGRRPEPVEVDRITPAEATALGKVAASPPPVEGPLRVGYVAWDWPALSQTFVLSEIQELQSLGHDVVVYFHVDADVAADVTFEVTVRRVADAEELAAAVVADARQVMHTPFAYPGATRLVWPAAEASGIPFTFMAGGVDVAHYENIKRNRVGEVASSPLCLGVVTLGRFHRDLLLECGVPSHRIVMERQSAVIPALVERRAPGERPVVISIARFIEKKGIEYLVRAAAQLPEVDVVVYGYGPLEDQLREVAASLGVTNVTFAGALRSQEDLDRAYGSADLFVLPCVRAENGDLDGLPTVLLEAMGSGLPVVSTTVANIPDLVIDGVTGFLAEPRDVDSLVAALRRGLALDDDRRASLVATARRHAVGYAGAGRTTETLLRLWRRTALDIVLVTFDREGYRAGASTVEIIERLYRFTTLPFTVTVVDNASDAEFVAMLTSRFGDRPGFRLLALDENVFCGPASDIGFGAGTAPWLVYVCSKEGFVLRHGWDHQMVRVLERTGAAMGGQLVQLAAHPDCAGMRQYPGFEDWRSQEFAAEHPDHLLRHVQGGLFVMRRDVFEEVGGFNPRVPQNGMDVEMSYHLEASGHRLVSVPGVLGVSTLTRPRPLSLADEFLVALHPATVSKVEAFDDVVERRTRLCPICFWTGPAFEDPADGGRCPQCGSLPFSRSAWRVLSRSGLLQTRPGSLVVARDPGLEKGLRAINKEDMRVVVTDDAQQAAAELVAGLDSVPGLGVVVVDRYDLAPELVETLVRRAGRDCVVVLGSSAATADALVERARGLDADAEAVQLVSGACAFDTGPLVLLGVPWDDAGQQGTEV